MHVYTPPVKQSMQCVHVHALHGFQQWGKTERVPSSLTCTLYNAVQHAILAPDRVCTLLATMSNVSNPH